ncbi:MAG: T9SS type A sorting domain-containing protein [Flavobacteriales bacterium]
MKYLLIPAFIAASFCGTSQTEAPSSNTEIEKVQCTNFFITPPLRELTNEAYEDNPPMKIGKDRIKREFNQNPNAAPEGPDPVRQTAVGTKAAATIIVNEAGINGGFPPDPSGAIGPNHYVQAVNSTWKTYDTEGNTLSFPVSLASLWSGSSNDGDPIVMYDQFVDRWFISQFQTGSNQILIAISVTPDPLEEYYAYEFNLSQFPDYPKYSIWGDAYYMSANSFGHDAVAFEREKMIAGDPTASMIAFNTPSMPTGNFYSMLPADADGDLPPVGTPNYFFHPGDNQWGGNSFDHIRIYEFNVDWDNPGNSGIQLSQQLEVESFNANFTPSWDDIPQPGTNQRLDAIAGIFTYRAQYRRWIGYNTMVLTMVVDINGFNQAGIRWYELRQEEFGGELGDWYVYQQGTYAPDDDLNRWMASASMDDYGNIGMAYSIGGSDLSASLAVTGRFPWDPLGEMTVDETFIIEGSGAQTGGNRFGDYSHMTLAPDGETFWFTSEYIANSNRRTRIASFKLYDPLSLEEQAYRDTKHNIYQNGTDLQLNLLDLPNSDLTQIDIFDIKGALMSSEQITPSANEINTAINISNLSSGVYMVRFGNTAYQVVEKVSIQN